MSSKRHVELTVNSEVRTVEVEPRVLLADALRHELGLTGTHVGCEQGSCGACTVIIDDRAQRSCLMLAIQATDATIETIEGVTTDGIDHPVQTAMHAEHGLQCGFCTPGIVMSLVAAHRAGVPAEIAKTEVLGGHICRCTGYVNIRAAVDAAWAELDGIT
jgi:aerobic-type carbon monoxide dehydrogenase small subunit (CoxS/CutS family)